MSLSRNTAAWLLGGFFDDSELVVIELPDSDDKVYCAILGSGGIERGLAVYRGDEGLAGFLAIMTGIVDPGSSEALNTTDAVSATLADREELDKEERDVIRSLGLRYRGRGRWPLFRAYEPGWLPWRLEHDEPVMLAAALRCITSLTVAVRQGDLSLDDEDRSDLFLTMSFRSGRWHGRWDYVPVPLSPSVADYADADRLEQFAQSARRSDTVWELGMYYLLAPLWEEKGKRPHLPVCAMLVHADTGYVGSELLTQPRASDADRQELLVKILEALPGLPLEIVVNTPRLAVMVESVTAPLGIKLSVGETTALWEARDELFGRIEDGPPDSCWDSRHGL